MSLSFFHSSRLINMSWHADYLSSSTSSTGMNMFSKWIYKFNLPSEHFAALFTRCTFEAVICTIFENRFNQFFCLSDSKIPLYSRKYLDNRGPFSFHIRSVKNFWHLMATHHTNICRYIGLLNIYVIHFSGTKSTLTQFFFNEYWTETSK